MVLAVAIGRSRSQLAVFDLEGARAGRRLPRPRGRRRPRRADAAGRRAARRACSPTSSRRWPAIGLSLPGTVDAERGRQPRLAGDGRLGRRRAGAVPRRASPTRRSSSANDADVLARVRAARPAPTRCATPWSSRPRPAWGSGSSPTAGWSAGHLGAAGEIGHTRVDAADGPALPVRRAPAASRRWPAAGRWSAGWPSRGREVGHVRDLVALALQGDAEARGLLRESGRQLGELLAVAVNLLNPQAVVDRRGHGRAPSTCTPRGCARASTPAPRRWPPATCSSCPPPTATGPGWSAAPRSPWSTCSAPAAVDARLAARRQPRPPGRR